MQVSLFYQSLEVMRIDCEWTFAATVHEGIIRL